MDPTEVLTRYKRFLTRVNYSKTTVRNYTFILRVFLNWVTESIDEITCDVIVDYIGSLHHRRLGPKTINCYLDGIRRFYDYLAFEERKDIVNPVKNDYKQILPKPFPRFHRVIYFIRSASCFCFRKVCQLSSHTIRNSRGCFCCSIGVCINPLRWVVP